MVQHNYGPDTSYEARTGRRMQIIFARKMRERQIFMDELKELRRQTTIRMFRAAKRAIGPIWYHALSVPQRIALDALEVSIYQDILEGRPVRTAKLMREFGLYPHPNKIDLMNCLFLGQDDPKEMLAQLFLTIYGHSIEVKRSSYDLNSKLILSGILYLGLNNLIALLKERFRPDKQPEQEMNKEKPIKRPSVASPYLQEMVAALYEPPIRKRQPPQPLPNLENLNDPYEDVAPTFITIPPPPPPVPPTKKRLPRAYCDKIAGIMNIQPHSSLAALTMKTTTRTSQRRLNGGKFLITEVKKTYGMNITRRKKGKSKKLAAPSTGIWNAQYTISGVYRVAGKTVFVISNVSILPPIGDLIHGGYREFKGEYINIHCGFRGITPAPEPDPCNCVNEWEDKVLQFVKSSKCYCEHYYDYGNEGTFSSDELAFFLKPTKHKPFSFNYETIYDIDPKRLHIEKEFKKIWETDSMLQVDDGTAKDKKDKKKKKKRASTTCLGQNPSPEDYLKCALRLMRRVNIAARLPDIHLVPELTEWMRKRLYGSFTDSQKKQYKCKSTNYWEFFHLLASKGYGHVSPPIDSRFSGLSTWSHKQDLNDKFNDYVLKYKLSLFRSLAKINNLLWPTMCQTQFPDKKFREIYFSYLYGRVEDLLLMHPYSSRESQERKLTMSRKRYCCLPAGAENLEGS